MSAIFGIYNRNKALVTGRDLAALHDAMAQWGLDGHGTWKRGEVGLGHLMLHVTPESLSEQLPMAHPRIPDLVITADARIDNRGELFDALGIAGPRRFTMPDSMLILLAYEKWKNACPTRLIGDFAFVIWDGRRKTLFCSRDPMGCKPFFYHHTPRRFIFASDIRGLVAHPQVPKTPNEPLLAACLQQMTEHAEKRLTFLKDVLKLPPAHHLTITTERIHLERYWSLEDVPEINLPSDTAYTEQLRELLRQAVECRLRSAFPVGSHLSGGLDSSTLTAMAARSLRQSGKTLTAFSWSPPPAGNRPLDDERADVEAVCRREGIPCHYTTLFKKDVIRVYTSDFTTEPTEMMFREQHVQARAADNGVRVMLSGWGGDEGISHKDHGYWPELLLTRQWSTLRRELNIVTRARSVSLPRRILLYPAAFYRRILPPLVPDNLYRLKEPYGVNHPSPMSCIHPDFARHHRTAVAALRGPGLRDRPGLHAMQCRRLNNGHLTKRMESWAISGAGHRLVYRYPLLDRRILEFALGIPSRMFYENGERRILFRRAVEGILPPRLQWKPGKFEAATFGVTRHIFPGALAGAFARAGTVRPDHPASNYVDMARLAEMMSGRCKLQPGWGVLENAVWCFSIRH